MSYRTLRACAVILTVLGWVSLVFSFILGFVPWLLYVGEIFTISSPWERWVIYLSPVAGAMLGVLSAVTYLVIGQLMRVFLDQRDLLEELVAVNRRLLGATKGEKAENQVAPTESNPSDPFQIDQSLNEDLPNL